MMKDQLRTEMRRLANTVIWSLDGWRAAWATEKTLRQWTLANLLSAALAFTLDLSPAERGLILALGLLVLAAELMNTGFAPVPTLIGVATLHCCGHRPLAHTPESGPAKNKLVATAWLFSSTVKLVKSKPVALRVAIASVIKTRLASPRRFLLAG